MSIANFSIIDSTLREGEQFIHAYFSQNDKVEIATALSDFGVEYIELTSPFASPHAQQECKLISKLGLQSKLLTHIRCNLEDAKMALDVGVDGINIAMGTSWMLSHYGHGKAFPKIVDLALEVLSFVREQAPNVELRFSAEDSIRSSMQDLITLWSAIDRLGVVDRLGIADTVGIATPHQIGEFVRELRKITSADIEFHGHNDTGCAISNSFSALEAGATHIDTCVLGIGERNGITALEGFIARMYTINKELVLAKYRLKQLAPLCRMVAKKLGVAIPFNHYIIGETAFSHKAGIHTKAVLANPETYEPLNPEDFGLQRNIAIAHQLTGVHAIAERAKKLQLHFSIEELRSITTEIKSLPGNRKLTLAELDRMLLHKAT